jgi:uncharacterized membrane protein
VEQVLEHVALVVGTAIEALAIALIAIGVLQAMVRLPGVMFRERAEIAARAAWLDFARWLVAALTLQLAADIVHTTVAPTWEEIGRVAAIAAIRTFLTFAFDRELSETRARQAEEDQGRAVAESARG